MKQASIALLLWLALASSVAATQVVHPGPTPPTSPKAANPNFRATAGPIYPDLYELEKIRAARDIEKELMNSLQTRFWMLTGLTLILGFFGVRSLVRELVASEIKDAMKATAEAQAAASLAKDSIKEVRAETSNYKDVVVDASLRAEQVAKQLDELKSRIVSEGDRTVALAESRFELIDRQVKELQDALASISDDSDRHRRVLAEAESKIEQLRAEAKANDAEFAENAGIEVKLASYNSGISNSIANELRGALAGRGFRVTTSNWVRAKGSEKLSARISHTPDASEAAQLVRRVAEQILQQHGVASIELCSTPKPISNTDDQLVLFIG